MRKFTVLACITIAFGVSLVVAQTKPVTPPSGGAYYGGYPFTYHSSTAAEGRMRGLGDVVRSKGQANLDNSAAAINYSLARQQEISNRAQWTNTYFDMRHANRTARAQERRKRSSMEELTRFAQEGRPRPLSPSELDTVTGAINWPTLLTTEDFAKQRAMLEKVFERRAYSSVIGYTDLVTVKKTTDAMLEDLKAKVSEVLPAQYIAAKRFLQSIAYEATKPVS